MRVSRGGGVAALAFTLSIAFAALLPTSASAAVSCSYVGGTHTLTVTADAHGDAAALRVESGGGNDDIEVFQGNFTTEITPCGGVDQPTIADTDTIELNENAAGTSNVSFRLALANGPFAPGFTDEPGGSDEIEFDVAADADGVDDFQVLGRTGDDNIRFGTAGGVVSGNLNAGEIAGADGGDRDVDTTGIDGLSMDGQGGQDTITADGAPGAPDFDGPVPLRVSFLGGAGNDTLRSGTFASGAFSNALGGDAGDDTMTGNIGSDSIQVGEGNDVADGGGGSDSASYVNHLQGVTVDLRVTTQQDTVGAGLDTLTNFENAQGGNASDTITGTSGANVLSGGQLTNDTGDDTLIGLGGNDALTGGPGNDLLRPGGDNDSLTGSEGNDAVSYSDAAGAVTFSLDPALTGVAQSTGGAGNDRLADSIIGPPTDPDTNHEVENLTGSAFADNLTGNDLANKVVGGGGGDTISLLGGADEFEVLDGILDTVDCGADADSGVADELGVDALTDCESVDHAPQTSITGGPANGARINDRTPTYALSADESPVSFERRVDGGAFQPCSASCTLPSLSEGAHAVAFRATDGNDPLPTTDQTPATRIVTVDTAAPQTTITEGPGDATNDSTPTFQFSSSEAGSSFQCRVDGGSFASCSSPRTTAALDDGAHTFAVRARDQALNLDPSPASRAFSVDTDAPETTITKGPRKKTRKKKVTFEFSADEPGASFECALDGAAFSPCQSPMTVRAKKKGKHSFEVRATDEAGNADETPAEHTWKRKKRRR